MGKSDSIKATNPNMPFSKNKEDRGIIVSKPSGGVI
jgi:hypothetical protein